MARPPPALVEQRILRRHASESGARQRLSSPGKLGYEEPAEKRAASGPLRKLRKSAAKLTGVHGFFSKDNRLAEGTAALKKSLSFRGSTSGPGDGQVDASGTIQAVRQMSPALIQAMERRVVSRVIFYENQRFQVRMVGMVDIEQLSV
jgi:hypothetical protein